MNNLNNYKSNLFDEKTWSMELDLLQHGVGWLLRQLFHNRKIKYYAHYTQWIWDEPPT